MTHFDAILHFFR